MFNRTWKRSITTWLYPRLRLTSGSMDPTNNSSKRPVRVVSLLPSATEQFASIIAAAKELGHSNLPALVGRSHECDYPKAYDAVPILTKPRTTFTTCEETHNEVLNLLQNDDSLYEIDASTLTTLAPDLILVQDVCKVCSIDRPSVSCAMADTSTEILLMNSRSLENALEDTVRLLGKALHLEDAAEAVIAANVTRRDAFTKPESSGQKPIVYIVEWMEPLFLAKGWADEMVLLAGGQTPCETGRVLDPKVLEPPDIIVVALCGLDRTISKKELLSKPFPSWWESSPAVREGNVFVVDGNQMFNRPTDRLLDALEWLGQIIESPSVDLVDSDFPSERFLCESAPRLTDSERAIHEAHAAACAAKEARYTDPQTGYGVFTSYFLAERQACCGNRCRHCPYGHVNVPIERLESSGSRNAMQTSVFLRAPKPMAGGRLGYKNPRRTKTSPPGHAIVVFWSGGKDSLLALDHTIRNVKPHQDIVLLTTFNPDEHTVPIQNIDTRTIVAQASALNLPLFLVAVPTSGNYGDLVLGALKEIPGIRMPYIKKIDALVVGDLHLEDVRAWRVAQFSSYDVQSPLWKRDMKHDLLPELERVCGNYNLRVRYSAVNPELMAQIQEGDEYVPAKVPTDVDIMGENGEFHTVVDFL